MVATQSIPAGELAARADQRIILHAVPWSHYEVLLAVRGDAPVPRMAYLEGELELMSPSQETFAAETGVDLWPVGSWTVRSAPRERGIEPDECYTLGGPWGARRRIWPSR